MPGGWPGNIVGQTSYTSRWGMKQSHGLRGGRLWACGLDLSPLAVSGQATGVVASRPSRIPARVAQRDRWCKKAGGIRELGARRRVRARNACEKSMTERCRCSKPHTRSTSARGGGSDPARHAFSGLVAARYPSQSGRLPASRDLPRSVLGGSAAIVPRRGGAFRRGRRGLTLRWLPRQRPFAALDPANLGLRSP